MQIFSKILSTLCPSVPFNIINAELSAIKGYQDALDGSFKTLNLRRVESILLMPNLMNDTYLCRITDNFIREIAIKLKDYTRAMRNLFAYSLIETILTE